MKKPKNFHDWSPFAADERPVERFSPHGTYRLALAYANTYHVAMSSLAFQRVYELVHRRPEWSCERFFTEGEGMPLSVESRRPLDDFGCIAFSVSFEEDYVNLLQMLDRARIPLRRARPPALGPGDRHGRLLRLHQPAAHVRVRRRLRDRRGRELPARAALRSRRGGRDERR